MRLARWMALLTILFALHACAYSGSFGFPVDEGDPAAGRQAFVDHQCHQCHSVSGVSLPALAGAAPPLLELGGETSVARNFGQLMTSVINPNHSISERYRAERALQLDIPVDSPMPMPNLDNMTVRQLIDLVAFLDSRYILIEGYDTAR